MPKHRDIEALVRATLKLVALSILFLGTAAQAQSEIETVQVTATRLPESVGDVPADVSLISGDELRERQAHTLGSTLSLTAGVEAPSGGDAGPSGAVPSFWGLHEFDDFLLVVDGVPLGSPFRPAISDIDFADVQRVEVLKGSAPVAFGATSFVGVIQVVHYPAGEAANDLELAGGNYGSGRGAVSVALPNWDSWRNSFAADGEQLGFADQREAVNDGHFLYRAETPLGLGNFRLDADISIVRDVPPSPVVREGDTLTTLTPLNANYNPANAAINESRYHLNLGYVLPTGFGDWSTLVSIAHSDFQDIRGFLRPDLTDDGSPNADSQDQHRLIQDGYFDTHFLHSLPDNAELTVGTDLLFGLGRQRSMNGEYVVPLSGLIVPPPTTAIYVDEINSIRDERLFSGQYAEFDWRPLPALDVLAGLRLTETSEDKTSAHTDTLDSAGDEFSRRTDSKMRPSGMAGASYEVWKAGGDEAVLYTDYRNTFQPSEVDFGPDYTPDLLNPETGQSYELGFKGALQNARFTYDAEAFLLNLSNLVVAETDTNGEPILRNAGGERLKGFEIEMQYMITSDLSLAANLAYHDARFTNFVVDEEEGPKDVSGNQLTLAPHVLASGGLIYTPPQGFHGSMVANYVGRRFLDEENRATAPSYISVAITLGYRLGRYDVSLSGTNLTDQRQPVTQSEFGSSSYYLLPARTVWLQLGAGV